MAARLDPAHDERTRAKIQTSQLINRLFSHVNGEAELSASQVRAAEVLLKKTLPDLQAVTHDGEININPLEAVLNAINGRSREIPKVG